jgi:hypothetical protein
MIKDLFYNKDMAKTIAGIIVDKQLYLDTRRFTDKKEPLLRKAVQKLFKIQYQTVMQKFLLLGIDGIETLIDVKNEATTFNKLLKPVYAKILESSGQANLDSLLAKKSINKQESDGAIAGVTFDMTYPEALTFLETYPYQCSLVVNNTTRKILVSQLQAGIEEGESVLKIAKRINNVFNNADMTRSFMIAQTETSRTVNAGTNIAYKQSGVVEAKKLLTAMDGKVCPFCRDVANTIVDVSSNFFDQGDTLEVLLDNGKTTKMTFDYGDVGYPPLHPRCRCTITAVLVK